MSHLEKFNCIDCGGGRLRVDFENHTAFCPYCGGKFFFKEDKTDALVLALNQGSEHLKRNDFDSAIDVFNAVWQEYPTDAEAAWGVALSTYGIVYAKDDKTGELVPTCSRIVKQSILEHEAYLCAIAECAPEQRSIYEAKAHAIDELQRRIKRAMASEQDFDVFISFKAKDENGVPTEDSVIARRIYDELKSRGVKTFFSEVTLADRLGDEFEPIIYRALYSCKFFILVSTKEDYLNAVWVKNEWTRFRDRAQEENLSGACSIVFKNMPLYALPRLFQSSQGVDLEKHPYDYALLIADSLVKRLGLSVERAAPAADDKTAPLLRRAFLFLEDGEWEKANSYCEKVLDIDPENAEAYLGKLMVDVKIPRRSALSASRVPFGENANYKKALRFGDEALVAELEAQCRAVVPQVAQAPREKGLHTVLKQVSDSATDTIGRVFGKKKTEGEAPQQAAPVSSPMPQYPPMQQQMMQPQMQRPPMQQQPPMPPMRVPQVEELSVIKKRIAKEKKQKSLLVWGIIWLLLCLYVGVGVLVYRAYQIGKMAKQVQQKQISERKRFEAYMRQYGIPQASTERR